MCKCIAIGYYCYILSNLMPMYIIQSEKCRASYNLCLNKQTGWMLPMVANRETVIIITIIVPMNKMQWNSLLILMKNYDDIQLTVNGFLQFYLRWPYRMIPAKSISQTDKHALDAFAYMRKARTRKPLQISFVKCFCYNTNKMHF